MTLESIVVHYGYPALIIGLLVESETMVVLGAFLAHRGYLDLRWVILIGCLVTFAYDQFFFWMGRLRGSQFLENKPAWKPHIDKANSLLGWNPNLLFFGVRFIYGLRSALAFTIGMARFDPKKFAVLNFIGAFVWALTFGLAGNLVGQLMGAVFEDVREHELAITLGILIVGTGVWLYYRYTDKVQKTN